MPLTTCRWSRGVARRSRRIAVDCAAIERFIRSECTPRAFAPQLRGNGILRGPTVARQRAGDPVIRVRDTTEPPLEVLAKITARRIEPIDDAKVGIVPGLEKAVVRAQ